MKFYPPTPTLPPSCRQAGGRGMRRFPARGEEEGKGFPQDRRRRMGYAPNYSPIFLLANYF